MRAVCANCGIEFNWQPTIVDGAAYCCIGCSQGGPCCCDYSRLPQPDDSTALASVPQGDNKTRSAKYEQNCWY
ncbi:MAG: hypothetical protein H8E47_11135 [Anaerolineales bacterium]|nr:hypothetical protein [Anaerolineales bacterium]